MRGLKIIKGVCGRNVGYLLYPRIRLDLAFNGIYLLLSQANFKINRYIHGILDGMDGIVGQHKQQKQRTKNYQGYSHNHGRGQRQPKVAPKIDEAGFYYTEK